MRDDQADQMIELLQGILDGVNALRSDFLTFTAYGTENMSDHAETIINGITGSGGGNLGDIETALGAVENAVVLVELAVGLVEIELIKSS